MWRVLLSSLALAVMLVLTKRWHGALTLDFTDGVQKLHTEPTPRIGGVPIFVGLAMGWPLMPEEARPLFASLCLAAVPAAIFGLAEDMTRRVGVAARLFATLLSGALFWWLSGHGVTRVDIPWLDWTLSFLPLSIALTAFAVGGMANAINIIDGLNGLAGLAVMCALAGFGAIAGVAGDPTLAILCCVIGAAVFGFWCVNWPLGKIFLGDGGAYFLGFALGATAILLTERNPAVSVFAALLVCVHPVTEVIFSIWRRRFRDHKPGHADCLHLHSLIKRRYVQRLLPRASSLTRNSVAGLLVGLLNLLPAAAALLLYDSTALSVAAVLGFALAYVAIYARLVRFHWCSPIGFLLGTQPVTLAARR